MNSASRLGQNFLINRNVAQKIIDAFLPVDGKILEVGPGKGILTEKLITAGVQDRIIAIELSGKLSSALASRKFVNLQVINRNILEVDLGKLFSFDEKINVISNVPYYISTEFIDWVISQEKFIVKGIFMMQREFVNKLIPPPGSKNSSAQTIMFNQLFQPKKLFMVNPGSFWPPPKVKSVVFIFKNVLKEKLSLTRKKLIPYYQFLKICHLNKRKTLINNLAEYYQNEMLRGLFESLHLDLKIRVEQLRPVTFLAIFQLIGKPHT